MNHCLCMLYLKWRHFTKNMSKSISANGFTQFNRSRSRKSSFLDLFSRIYKLRCVTLRLPHHRPHRCVVPQNRIAKRESAKLRLTYLIAIQHGKFRKILRRRGQKSKMMVTMDRYISLLKTGNSRSTNIMGNPGLWPTNQLIKKTLNNSPVNIW